MRVRKTNRYYCDFCPKANCSSGAMRLHERHCTMNPNRSCRICKHPRDIPSIVKSLPPDLRSSYYDDKGNPTGVVLLAQIRTACNNCPACILTIVRQASITPVVDFDYKEEVAKWWARDLVTQSDPW